MKNACAPQATQITMASSSHGPVASESPPPPGMLNRTIAASAATTPMTASRWIRSRSSATAMSTVITGDSDTSGKIR